MRAMAPPRHRQVSPNGENLTATGSVRGVLTSGPVVIISAAVLVIAASVLIVVAQDSLGFGWSSLIEIVAIIAGASAIRMVLSRRRQNPPGQSPRAG
jgi:hypothetical protein